MVKDFDVIHAYYGYYGYEGEAFVVLRSPLNGSIWEVNGSHCSCHGLEGQWDMELTTAEALIKRHQAQHLPGLDESSDAIKLWSPIEKYILNEDTPTSLQVRAKPLSL